MKALEIHAPRDLRMAERETPKPGPGDVLLKVTAVGVCGSDVHYYTKGHIGDAHIRPGFVLGHEFAGEIAALGEGVSVRQFTPGDRVAVEPAISCGACHHCERGAPNLCLNLRFAGQPPDSEGALQEYLPWPARFCFKLPDALSDAEGALLEPFGVGLYAVELVRVQVADTVVIVGCGPIGLSTLMCARLAGAARVIVLDKLAYRLSVARELGADDTLLVTSANDHVDTVLEWTGGHGAEVVFEAAGDTAAMHDAAEMAARGGRVGIIGIPPEEEMYFNTHHARRKELNIQMVRRMKHTYPRAIALAEQGRIDLSPMVTHTFALEDSAEAFDLVADYAGGVIKAVIEPGREK